MCIRDSVLDNGRTEIKAVRRLGHPDPAAVGHHAGAGAFTFEGNKLNRAQGTSCTRGSCALILETETVFRGDGAFCTKQEGAFYIEQGGAAVPTLVYLAEGPFAAKSDALLEVKGPLEPIALLAILAGY